MRPTSKWLFVLGLPKGNPETAWVRTFVTLRGYNFVLRPLIGMKSKQSCSYCQKLSNGVSHATCMHRFRSILDFLFSRVKLSILTPDLFFCHNLCCRCPNGSCEPILDIYTSITLRCYKKLFNAKCFDLCNRSLKVRESTRTLTPKMGAHLGV